MRLNPLRWLWGLVPVAMLCWIALLSERGRIEEDLRARAQSSLGAAGLGWAASSFTGRDAVLTGQAADDDEPTDAAKRMLETWGVRVVDNRAELVEKVDVYKWSASERDNKLRLAGFVPNESTRKAVLAAAKSSFPRAEVEDGMRLARGAPPRDSWLAGVGYALKNLAQLRNGSVELEGTSLSIAGAAETPASYRTLRTALSSAMPQGFRLKSERITPPVITPYAWSARLAGAQLALSGFVPGEAQRQQISGVAKAAFPRAAIVDGAELGAGAPDGFVAAASAALRELARLEEGSLELRGNQLSVAGMATDDVIADAVRKSLRERMPASIRLAETIRFKAPAVPTFDPFRTQVEATPAGVALTGHVPSEAAKAALAETARARFPGKRIDNALVVGKGAAPGWQACMQAAMASLGRLGGGKAELVDDKLELSGETLDEALHGALPGELRQATGQACTSRARITLREQPEPTLRWKAQRTAGQIVLEGEVPDAATKDELAQQAGRLFPGLTLVDRSRVANVPARRWPEVATAGLQQLARLRFGAAEINAQQLTINGETGDRATMASIQEQLSRRLAKGYSGRETIEVRSDADIAAEEARRRAEADARRRAEEQAALDARRRDEEARRRAEEAEAKRRADEAEARRRSEQAAAAEAARRAEAQRCQEALRRVARAGVILFERASADINARSHGTLDELARTLKVCPTVTVEIEGHTDAEGAPDRNQRLSERRAESVRQYLTDAGADAERLVAVGYGQDKPIAPNDTAENRARNRRIEFTVKTK